MVFWKMARGLGLRRCSQWTPVALVVVALAFRPPTARAREIAPFTDPVRLPRPFPIVNEHSGIRRPAKDTIPRIQCPTGYTARIYVEDLSGPDGLAFSPSGALYVAEETAGRVSRIEPDGDTTPVVTGLAQPEGVAFDDTGNLYVVEDVPGGRLVQVAKNGTITTLVTGLDAPEGVVWSDDSRLYVTESNIEFFSIPQDPLRTHVTVVSPLSGQATRIVTDTLSSYAAITIGPDERLYVTNEASGLINDASIFTVDPDSGTRSLFAIQLTAPEGLRFAEGGFPLYVAEEDAVDGTGRLTRVEAGGNGVPFCSGFYNIEDVALDEDGVLYVSEDGSGSIIVIEAEASWQIWLPLIVHSLSASWSP